MPSQIGSDVGQYLTEAFTGLSRGHEGNGVRGDMFEMGSRDFGSRFVHSFTHDIFGGFHLGKELEEGGGGIVSGNVGIDQGTAFSSNQAQKSAPLADTFRQTFPRPRNLRWRAC